MSAVPSFPLFNLPLVPFKEVISNMDLIYQVCFLMLSKKINNLVKTKHLFDMEVRCGYSGTFNGVVCRNENGSTFVDVQILEFYQYNKQKYGLTRIIGGLAIPMTVDNHVLKTFWEDKKEGLQKMSSLLCKILRVGSLSIELFKDTAYSSCEAIKQTRKLEFESQISIREIRMIDIDRDKVAIRYLLEKCSDISEVTVWHSSRSSRLPDHLEMTLSGTESYCEIMNADWMTFNDLNLLTKYKKIKLWKLKLTNQELNSFINKWMESSTMENVELTVENVDHQIALEGLQVTNQIKHLTFHGTELGPMDCFEIQRSNGMKANFWIHGGYIVMKTFQ